MKTVFFDVDTQFDFLLPAGSLYVPGAETIIPGLHRLARFAAANSIPLISTADAHTEDDPEFVTWKPHCIAGTVGQQKPLATLLPESLVIPSISGADTKLSANIELIPQFILEKQHTDCFTNPNLKPLLALLRADLYVVYGVATEICVQQAVLGLLAMGARVHLVTDAVRGIDASKAEQLFPTLQAQGGSLTTIAAVAA